MRKNIFTKIAAVAAATVLAVTALPALVSDTHAADDEYSYVYAGLTWQEYWANEGVYNAGDVTSSNEKDTHGEYDKGGFDTVTRATTNHGLHRGSYQCMATIDTEDGKKYELAGWSSDGKQMILTDGTQLSYNRGTITNADGSTSKVSSYDVTGIKYVPVKVKTSDLADFEQHYRVVKNGEKLYGGFGENKLSSYEYTAAVNADTNGIKTAVKNADGTYMGSITLRTAVSLSRNTVAWNVLKELTPKVGSSYLLNQGFHKVWMDKEYNAIAIGGFTYGVSTEEMAGAYATIANDGEYRRVTCVSQIKDTRGRIVYDSSGRGQKIYDAESCRMMTDMLETAVNEGTGRGAAPDNAIVAGKTGTTNSNYDSWFCGYSAYYTVAVWQGYDYPASIPQSHTKDIFRQFMQDSHKTLAKKDFPKYRQKSDNKETETESVSETQTETQSVSETQSVTQTQKGSQIQSPSQMETGTARDNDATAGTRQDSTAGGSESRADTDKPAETKGDISGY